MRQVIITGPDRSAVVERPEPRIRDAFVKVKIEVAPLCTEYRSFARGEVSDCLGHEAAGVVAEVARKGPLAPGDRVVVMPQYPCGRCRCCREGDYIYCEQVIDPLAACASETGMATYAQYCIKEDWLLLPVPDEVSLDRAAMACCGLGPAFGAMQRLGVGAGEVVVVVGLWPVGLGAVINGVWRGAKVIGVDRQTYRLGLARELGAQAVIDTDHEETLARVRELTGGAGADVALDCTGVPAAQAMAVASTRRRGRVGMIGWGGRVELDNPVPSGRLVAGCWHWNLHDADRMFRLIRDCGPLLDRLITHRFPMSRVSDAWRLQASGDCGKVLLYPWKEEQAP